MSRTVIKDGMKFSESPKQNKKYMVQIPAEMWNKVYPYNMVTKEQKVHFGDTRYGHFKDLIGLFHEFDHLDPKRRQNYFDRHSKIMMNEGTVHEGPAYTFVYSPEWFSMRYLW